MIARWINEEQKLADKFEWQKGYGVFSVSQSLRKSVSSYIQNQRQHHAKQSFEDEYFQTLQEYEIGRREAQYTKNHVSTP